MTNLSYQPHHLLLRDAERTRRFKQAIEATVRPGDTVVDLGAGTGVLSLFAAKAGAARVISLELDANLCEMIRNLAADNGVGDIVQVVQGRSQDFHLDGQADVIICDAMGFFGVSEEMDAFFDLRQRLLAPHGLTVPAQVELYAAPVHALAAYEWLDINTADNYGLDLKEARRASLSGVYAVHIEPQDLLAVPQRVDILNPAERSDSTTAFSASFVAARPGILHGLAGWYRAELAQGVVLSSGPFTQRVMGRSRLFLSPDPQPVAAGDTIAIEVRSSPTISFWSQRVGDGASLRQSSLAGHPAWRHLSFADSDWPAGLEDYCFAKAASAASHAADWLGDMDDRRLSTILSATVAAQNGGVFTGLK